MKIRQGWMFFTIIFKKGSKIIKKKLIELIRSQFQNG